MPTGALLASSPKVCGCRQCLRDRDERVNGFPAELSTFIVCSACGCKRCPHATDHRNVCTGSNEPGQPGSAYAAFKAPIVGEMGSRPGEG